MSRVSASLCVLTCHWWWCKYRGRHLCVHSIVCSCCVVLTSRGYCKNEILSLCYYGTLQALFIGEKKNPKLNIRNIRRWLIDVRVGPTGASCSTWGRTRRLWISLTLRRKGFPLCWRRLDGGGTSCFTALTLTLKCLPVVLERLT